MNFKENIRIALFSIKTNLLRSLLTMLGIIIGVSSVITIITIGDGGRDFIVGMIEDMGGSSIVNITVNMDATGNDYITPDDIAAIKNIAEVDYISPVFMGMGSAETQFATGLGMTIGCNTDIEQIMAADCKYGRYFNSQEYLSASAVAVIDSTSALAMFGEENCVGQQVSYTAEGRTTTIKIIGVMSLLSSFGGDSEQMSSMMESFGGPSITSCMLLIPSTLSAYLLDSQERYDTIYLSCIDEKKLDAAGETALSILQARHGNQDRDVYTVTNMAQFVDLIDNVIRIFTLFIAAVSAISLVVGGVGVMNIMLVSVMERTREIGIRKALGARTQTILMQFLTESVVLCFIGGVIGLIGGVSLAAIAGGIIGIPVSLSFWTVLLSVGFSSAIGIFFGIYPAKRAAQLPPIEALRKE